MTFCLCLYVSFISLSAHSDAQGWLPAQAGVSTELLYSLYQLHSLFPPVGSPAPSRSQAVWFASSVIVTHCLVSLFVSLCLWQKPFFDQKSCGDWMRPSALWGDLGRKTRKCPECSLNSLDVCEARWHIFLYGFLSQMSCCTRQQRRPGSRGDDAAVSSVTAGVCLTPGLAFVGQQSHGLFTS